MSIRKILVLQTAFIGDVILATAVVEQLYARFPEAQIDFLLRKGNEGLLKGHPLLSNVLIWDKKHRKYSGLWKLWRQIRSERYELVINLQRFLATGFLTAFSGAPNRVGFNKNPLSLFFSHRFPHPIGSAVQPVHEVSRNLSLLSPWMKEAVGKPRLYPHPEDTTSAPPPGSYVCLAPTSVWYTKQWPAERWAKLIDQFPPNLHVFLLGGPSDREACAQIRKATTNPKVENKAGELSFLASAAWMGGARMNYVNDSAPLHMASAMNAPVVAVFCSTIPAFGFGPLSDRAWVVETDLSLACRPCGLHGKRACPEGHFHCAEIDENKLLHPLESV
ncbi:MAG: glycosyltransferase family 9 protein [Saprospirales bacterium]|nr:glycosyltransferase family 9 protein [Saprospirales bacterium]